MSELVLTRDELGLKPLYYSIHNSSLHHATKIETLFKSGVPCEVNYDMIPTYLMYQYSMGMHTLFKGVYKVPAGHTLTASADKVKLERYWHITDEGVRLGSYGNPIEHLRYLLEEYTKQVAQSDTPAGSFLSGGLDSSLVTALYRKYYEGDLHTFTASFNSHSEAEYAKKVSEHLNTIYHEVCITADMVAQDIEKITHCHDEPLGDAATINNYYLAREAKKYVDIILAGEGGDEVFGGYPWQTMASYISMMNTIPKPLRHLGQELCYWLLSKGDVTSRLYRFNRVGLFPCQTTLANLQLYLTTAMNQQNIDWLTNLEQINGKPELPKHVHDPYNQMLAMDCMNKLPEQGNMKAYKATAAHGIEEKLPLLDPAVVEYAFSLDPKLKKDKRVLREVASGLLPSEIVWRPKKGFGTPLVEWMSSEPLKEMVIDRLENGKLLQEICRPEALEKLVGCMRDGLQTTGIMMLNPANVVWTIFALQVWYDTWFGWKGQNDD